MTNDFVSHIAALGAAFCGCRALDNHIVYGVLQDGSIINHFNGAPVKLDSVKCELCQLIAAYMTVNAVKHPHEARKRLKLSYI